MSRRKSGGCSLSSLVFGVRRYPQPIFRNKAILMSSKSPFTASPCFGRIGRDHLNPQAFHGTTKLGQLVLLTLPPSTMTSTITIH